MFIPDYPDYRALCTAGGADELHHGQGSQPFHILYAVEGGSNKKDGLCGFPGFIIVYELLHR